MGQVCPQAKVSLANPHLGCYLGYDFWENKQRWRVRIKMNLKAYNNMGVLAKCNHKTCGIPKVRSCVMFSQGLEQSGASPHVGNKGYVVHRKPKKNHTTQCQSGFYYLPA